MASWKGVVEDAESGGSPDTRGPTLQARSPGETAGAGLRDVLRAD